MKITIEQDGGETIVYQYITDYYLAIRQFSVKGDSETKDIVTTYEIKSFSFGANIREIVKELAQSLLELQDYLKCYLKQSKEENINIT